MEQLRPMQLPDPISWWPLALGWWLLLVLIIASVFALLWWLRRRWADPRRYALAELKNLQACYSPESSQQSGGQAALLTHCNQLLKRTALTLYPRHDVASLSGEAWIAFLLSSSKGCEAEALQCLKNGAYQQNVEYDSAALLKSCRQWLKTAGKGGHNNA